VGVLGCARATTSGGRFPSRLFCNRERVKSAMLPADDAAGEDGCDFAPAIGEVRG
jgi:hypothetical protein